MHTRTGTVGEAQQVTRLRLVLVRLARRIRQEMAAGVTPSQLSALAVLSRSGPMRLGTLAEAERVSKPTVTRIVAALEEAGYVARRSDPADGRCSRVAITADGEAVVAALRDRADAFLARRMATLSGEERARLADALPVLERVLEVSG